jgi:small multidrug resistance pump
MYWFFLAVAIVLEVVGTTCMKLSEGFTRLIPSILVFVLYMASFTFMILALKKMELGIVYAIWAGLGTALIALIGIVWFQESVTLLKIVSLVLVVAGVVGLQLSQTASGMP